MTLFERAAEPETGPAGDPDAGRRDLDRREARRMAVGWSLLGLGVVGTLVLGFMPAPYVIERPGPVFDTLGEVTAGGEEVPLIDIPGEQTYETSGTLDLLTVNILGSRENPPSWLEIASSWFDPARAVVAVETVFPEGVTEEQSTEQSAVEMRNSQQEAVAAALRELDYEYTGIVRVAGIVEDTPAVGLLEPDDEILSVGGTPIEDVTRLRELIAESGAGTPLVLGIRRDGRERELEITPVASDDDGRTPVIGVYTAADYDFPVDVRIQLEDVGGPSAGMMFALGIIDKLTPGEMTGGESIAGTGTIAADGTVGPIGGIRQKMHGARDAGADWFLAPAANCDEVVGAVPDGIRVFAVETLDDAIAAVEAVASGKGLDALPSCGAG
ncbi:YlbL family protein [Homoserinibacter sp. YIM 151385]|uniref:YlbL family protein n=1 Tax=Homoserinibacter sp. YIM 151385 TaxID=2985506 RepID=UPI0022F0A1A0|nr:PDZ domain-containing protein [Homoserinibacter sp. YIM 151385]WBU38157.1 PDZ domain-containing protein [Homoserinibacter sp. YIM 151385]